MSSGDGERRTRDEQRPRGKESVLRHNYVARDRDLTPTWFLDLRLEDGNGKPVSTNFYLLSVKPDLLDWGQTVRLRAPSRQHADFAPLSKLPKVELKVSGRSEVNGGDGVTHVTLESPSRIYRKERALRSHAELLWRAAERTVRMKRTRTEDPT